MSRKIYPLYLVIDSSGSMKNYVVEPSDDANGVRRIDLASSIPSTIFRLYEENPLLVANLFISVISFNKEATCHLELGNLTRLRDLNFNPTPHSRTYFSVAFEEVHNRIRMDFAAKDAEVVWANPAIILVTDGIPSDSPEVRDSAFRKLVPINGLESSDFPVPRVHMFGVGEAKRDFLEKYAYDDASVWVGAEEQSIFEQLNHAVTLIKTSVLKSQLKANLDDSGQSWLSLYLDADDELPNFPSRMSE
jgi:uncharacterized protein YegL